MGTLRTRRRATAAIAGGLALTLAAAPAAGAADDYTDDARAWKVVSAPSLPGVPGALVTLDGRFVALSGRYGALTSKDGRRWKASAGSKSQFAEGDVSGAVVGDQGLLAWGKRGPEGSEQIVFWRSKDGTRWTRTDGSAAVFGAPGASVAVRDIAPRGSGWIAVGGDATSGTLRGAVWRSKDGKSWTRVPVTGDELGDETHTRFVRGVAKGSRGYVAVGSERRIENDAIVEQPMAWTSKNGTRWRVVTGPDAIATPAGTSPTTRVYATSVVWDGKRYVALSAADEEKVSGNLISTSKDGRRWHQAELEQVNPIQTLAAPSRDRVAQIKNIVATQHGVIGIGTIYTRKESGDILNTGAIWASGRAGRRWRAVTSGPFTEPDVVTIVSRLAVSDGRVLAIGTRTPFESSDVKTVLWQAKA